MKKKARKKGFTLVEVLVVMAIIALLAATAIPKVKGIYEDAQLDKAEADAMQIAAAIQRVELKNELTGLETGIFTELKVLGATDFTALNVQVQSGSYIFRYSPTGLLATNTSSRVIQTYHTNSDISKLATEKLFREVIITE